MSHARETTLSFSFIYLSPLMSKVYLLVNFFEKPIHNAIRHFSFFSLLYVCKYTFVPTPCICFLVKLISCAFFM